MYIRFWYLENAKNSIYHVKVWEEIPEVNYDRQNASLFYHNEQYLYMIGGLCWEETLNDFVFVETVEKIRHRIWGQVMENKPNGK